MGLFDDRVVYKPFEYEYYYSEGWLPQAQAFWLQTEISMQSDIKDWTENLTFEERSLVGNILLGFAQTECAVSDYWTNQVTSWFPKHEIKQMAMMFGAIETVHAVAYSYLNESLGLEDYEAFLHEPETAARFDNLVAYKGNDHVSIGKSLAVFSAFAEGVSLYSAFAVLYSFQMRNKLKGIGQQMKFSVRDESLHSKMGCRLFRDMCAENDQLHNLCEKDILEAATTMVELESRYIDKMFEAGPVEGIDANDLKQFIKKRTNEKINELGYTEHKDYFKYDKEAASNLDWFDHLTGGVSHTDFFAIRSTDYSKPAEGEDFGDMW